MLYFSHDTKASVDEKIMQLRLEFGGAAVDAYWYLVERIYEKETKLVFSITNAKPVWFLISSTQTKRT